VRVFRLAFQIADITHDLHIVECLEGLRHFAFTAEQRLACRAPGLEIIWIRAVLDEANCSPVGGEEMYANYGRLAFDPMPTIDRQWSFACHGGHLSLVWLTILLFSGGRERERSDRRPDRCNSELDGAAARID
jgi:hypothetical protein